MLELNDCSQPASENTSDADRRDLAWHPCKLEAICECVDGAEVKSRPATIRAFCTHGMALVLGERWDPGLVLTVRMMTAVDRVAFAKLSRVVHNHPEKLGDWLIGVVFLRPLTSEEVTWLRCPEAGQSHTLFFDI